MLVAYPSEIPKESITYVIGLATGANQLGGGVAALHIWNVQGYLQRTFLGDGSDGPIVTEKKQYMIAPEDVNAKACNALGLLRDQQEGQLFDLGIGSSLLMDWLIKLLMKLISEWLNPAE